MKTPPTRKNATNKTDLQEEENKDVNLLSLQVQTLKLDASEKPI
jgi:hypothetical protein